MSEVTEKEEDKALTKYQWFHGLMPRGECEEILKEEGDFLVRRTTLAKVPMYCLTVRHNGEVKHIPVQYQKGIWTLNKDSKATLADLVALCMKEKRVIPPSNATLINGVHRPEYIVLHENVILKEKIGQGAFGEVCIGKLKTKTGELDVAVKRAKEGHTKKSQVVAFIREAKIMRRLDHPNIVRMYGVATQEEPIMIILELAANGSLKGYYKKNENVTVETKLNFAVDACRGMCYLSLEQIIHRDLAARNCLLGSNYEVKISDFGLSVADKRELRLNKLHKVPVRWLAPETIAQGVFTTKTDVWSFGVLLWEIFANCRSDPFPGETNQQAMILIGSKTPPMEPPQGSPPIIKTVMDLCFVKNPEQRSDFTNLLHVLSPNEAPPTVAPKTSATDLRAKAKFSDTGFDEIRSSRNTETKASVKR
ncbi:hypothetical protein Q1695_002207 [Nippostrongylus brasiliensis]|nr:hypothetical protein Q1695_002207 [Nippostrongylus brasiliensis]